MIELKDEVTIAEDAGILMSNVNALRHLTVSQWVELTGYAILGASAGGALTTHDWLGAAIGALSGVIIHLRGLLQTSPTDKAAQAARAAQATVAAVEAAGRKEIVHADSKKSAAAAADDFSKEMAQ